MNPITWFKLFKYRPRITSPGYYKRVNTRRFSLCLNSTLLLLNTFAFVTYIQAEKENIWLILLSIFAIGISAGALYMNEFDQKSIQKEYEFAIFVNKYENKVWHYMLFGGSLPDTDYKVEFPLYHNGSPLIINDNNIKDVILSIYKKALIDLEPALEERLNKPRFLKLKILYG
jgi:hypothetical protein